MAGYTRQSTGSIINGSPITAPPLNSEFNQVAAAFNATSGHSHDGSTGNSPKINLATSVSGYLPAVHGGIGGKNKLDATTTPTVTDDNNDGYAPGSLWEDTTTGRVYICVGNSTGAAVWRELVQVNSGTAILPAVTDTVDLGNNSTRFQDLFLSGGISASGNVAAGGTLNITGATALGSTLGVTGDTTLVNLSATGTTVINSIDLNSGAIDSTTIGTTTPAAGTFTTLNANTSLVAATADINGGTVDGATIGASTPSTGSFTTLGASGTSTLATVDINGGNIDGTAIGAAVQSTGAFTTVSTSGQATLATVDINGGAIDGATIGANATSSGAFTTLSASGGITGDIVGNVTGNSSGTHTGAVVGNVTGNLTGNITSSGTSSFNNVTVDGTLNMNAGTTATITNLTSPTNTNDAATKGYVDTQVANLVDSAPGTLDTLNELAAALGDDPNFSTTITNSIATKLPLAGGTMTGAIAMGTSKITGMGDPTAAQDASTKNYVDTQDALQVTKTGDSMSGNLAMGSNNITGLATPTANDHATNKSYVDGILGSATASSASASAAATSESNAATSETNAASSASAAAADRATVASLYDSFDDRYLGPKSSAPTQDNDGNALVVGALYFNSTNNIMYVYGSGGWQAAGSSVNGTSDRQTYTATAGQTVFAATYDAGYVDVYLNGVKLLAGTDFTATNGTSVTLASGASVNDIVDIVAYGTFVLADHLTQTQSDARYVNLSGDTMTGNLSLGDNDKAIFGSELEIYSDATHARIREYGSGQLKIQGDNMQLLTSDGASTYLEGNASTSAVTLYHASNSPRLSTTAIGIDVNGTVTADDIILSDPDAPSITLTDTTNTLTTLIQSGNSTAIIGTTTNHDLRIQRNSADIVDVLSTGIDVTGNTKISGGNLEFSGGTNDAQYIKFGDTSDDDIGNIFYYHGNNNMVFTTNASEAMRITSDGSVGIGGIVPKTTNATVTGSLNVNRTGIIVRNNEQVYWSSNIYWDASDQMKSLGSGYGVATAFIPSDGSQRFYTTTASAGSADANLTLDETMRLTSGGSVGISIDNPDAKLHVVGNTKLGSASSASWTNSLNDAGGLDLFVGSGSKALTVWDDNRQSAPRFQVDRDGQVGIGRAPISTFKLDVHDEVSGNWLAHFENTHNSNGYGVKIRAGDDGNVTSFRVSNYDNTNTLLNVYGDGSVTKPNTPAFHAKRNSNLSNPTVATVYDLSFVSERFDQGNDFNGTVFTAPVTGKYYLAVNLRLEQLQTNASYYQVYITTSNEAYQITLDPNFSGNLNYYGVAFSVLADMDGGDTAKIQWYQIGGSTAADINISSYFCGHLVA